MRASSSSEGMRTSDAALSTDRIRWTGAAALREPLTYLCTCARAAHCATSSRSSALSTFGSTRACLRRATYLDPRTLEHDLEVLLRQLCARGRRVDAHGELGAMGRGRLRQRVTYLERLQHSAARRALAVLCNTVLQVEHERVRAQETALA